MARFTTPHKTIDGDTFDFAPLTDRTFRGMKQGTTKHLNEVEAAVQQAKRLLRSPHPYPGTLRNRVAAGLTDQTIEHHEAMLLLIRNGKNGSAYALARSIFESMFRGMWFQLCATDAQFEYFDQNDELPLDASGKRQMNMTSMATAIDAATGCDPNDTQRFSFTDLKNRGWKALCSYTHGGLLQLDRRFWSHKGEPGYSEDEFVEITTTCTTCVMLLVGTFLKSQGRGAESQAVEALIIGDAYGAVYSSGQ